MIFSILTSACGCSCTRSIATSYRMMHVPCHSAWSSARGLICICGHTRNTHLVQHEVSASSRNVLTTAVNGANCNDIYVLFLHFLRCENDGCHVCGFNPEQVCETGRSLALLARGRRSQAYRLHNLCCLFSAGVCSLLSARRPLHVFIQIYQMLPCISVHRFQVAAPLTS
jgi:hypothetical protein